jgi:hypothetical protein
VSRHCGLQRSGWAVEIINVSTCYTVLFFCLCMFASAPALAQPPIAITACQKITKAGVYQVENSLVASTGDCLVITAANVTLNLNASTLHGAGSGDGVHVMPLAAKAFIEGAGATIEGFGEGIEIDGANAFAEYFTVQDCSDAGVLLKNAHQTYVGNFSTIGNANDGVHISGGTLNAVQIVNEAADNHRYGILDSGLEP